MSRNKKDIQPYWRPNFNIPSTLPDIKVIRTGFIVNSIAIGVALIAAVLLLQKEYKAYSLGATIQELQQQITVAEADDNLHLKTSQRFRDAANYVIEVDTFYSAPWLAHEFVADLLTLRPKDLIFTRLALSEQVVKQKNKNIVECRITISGEVRELPVLDEFKNALQEAEFLNQAEYTREISESLESKNLKTGIFPYRLTIVLTPSAAKPVKKGGA
ncbi:hypothetical protein [Coraliomargarita parva]|uniref:hypothetical protein n=1 Tax=Coraliomargarita parva TaxID=3014050 RepID=UPI0022B54114|nr:hypothetical protein [Coraliomargarita parva]